MNDQHAFQYEYEEISGNIDPKCSCGWRGTTTQDFDDATEEWTDHAEEAFDTELLSAPKALRRLHARVVGAIPASLELDIVRSILSDLDALATLIDPQDMLAAYRKAGKVTEYTTTYGVDLAHCSLWEITGGIDQDDQDE